MTEIVNLRSARKRKARESATAAADANRALHGRTKVEIEQVAQLKDKAKRDLDGAKRSPPED